MIIFFDIETIPERSESTTHLEEKYADKINFMPEFNKVFTIAVGYRDADGSKAIKSIEWEEPAMISEFFCMIKSNTLCGFNIKGFDIPFLVKRALHYNIAIPESLRMFGKKPWEMTNVIDLYEVYKHSGSQSGSLDLVCNHLNIESSKDGIDGSMVAQAVEEGRGQEVIEYCKEDVRATMDVYYKFRDINFI